MMKFFFKTGIVKVAGWVLSLAFAVNPAWSFSNDPIHHRLTIALEPSSRFARIEDVVQFKIAPENCGPFTFYLHADLKLSRYQVPAGWKLKTSEHDFLEGRHLKIEVIRNHSATCSKIFSMELAYSGVLRDLFRNPDVPADPGGFFFSGDSFFYPQTKKHSSRVNFEMQVSLPKPWHSVSQGRRFVDVLSAKRNTVTWKSSHPAEEIYLIGDRYHIYEQEHKGLRLYAFLLEEEGDLAERYLQTAKDYIDFYSRLIGPYPYEKFALVENSRQTGYGMPSFTLMGSRIIRFPFILHSSYPHEILHNWWGNGVFPNLKEGNWSEGLTAYLADHLLQELKGKGAAYRFQEMLKFSNYVNGENDFPLSDFGYRDSMASQAIGYAKLLMVFHMLRAEVGDEKFLKGLKKIYAAYKFRYAGYEDMRKVFEEESGQSLEEFFKQWVHRKGAPKIRLKQSSYVVHEDRYDLRLTVEQSHPAFKLKLPIAIWTTGSPVAEIHQAKLVAETQDFHFQLSKEPVAVRLDPYNEVFRLLGKEEAPASLGQTYGSQTVSAILPEDGNRGYQNFAEAVAKQENIFTGKAELPEGSVWVFGRNPALKNLILSQLKKSGIMVDERGISIAENTYPWQSHSFVFTINRTDNKKGTMTWVTADNPESLTGLIRKLPHYGKYGYLVFEGSAPENRAKGIWPSNPTGLQKKFLDGHPLLLPEQKPLTQLQPFN